MAPVPGNFLTAPLRCCFPDIAGDRPRAGMISDYCDFTMSSTFSATGQMLDAKRAGDCKLARPRRRRWSVFRPRDQGVIGRRWRRLASLFWLSYCECDDVKPVDDRVVGVGEG